MLEKYLFHCGINIRHSTIFMDSRLDGITFFVCLLYVDQYVAVQLHGTAWQIVHPRQS